MLRTELNVPHVYAESIGDLGRVQGFTIARDRYFEMELLRRFSSGTLTEILGDVALETDQEARGNGMWQVANHIRDGVGEKTLKTVHGLKGLRQESTPISTRWLRRSYRDRPSWS